MLCWPSRSPESFSSQLPGTARKSSSNSAAFNITSFRSALQLAVKPLDRLSTEQPLSLIVSKAADHCLIITRCANNVKRHRRGVSLTARQGRAPSVQRAGTGRLRCPVPHPGSFNPEPTATARAAAHRRRWLRVKRASGPTEPSEFRVVDRFAAGAGEEGFDGFGLERALQEAHGAVAEGRQKAAGAQADQAVQRLFVFHLLIS